MLKKAIRAKYTLECKQEAVRMAQAKGSIAEASRELGLPEQTLFNWVKATREGCLLPAVATGRVVSAEQMELARLRALPDLSAFWGEVYAPSDGQEAPDVDEALYGGFPSDEDRRRLARLLQLTPQEAALDTTGFDDPRLPELVVRWRTRN